MQSVKETAANIAASAKAGLEKTKATVQEKVEKIQAHSPMEKAMATEKKEERLTQAEINKLEAMKQNAAARHSPKGGGSSPGFTATSPTGVDNSYMTPGATTSPTGTATYSTTGEHDLSTGGHQMSAMPGHGTGHPTGDHVVEGTVESHSHPIGVNSGTGRTMAHNTRADRNPPGPYGGSSVDNGYMTPDATTSPTGTTTYSTTGEHDLSTGGHQMSAMPRHGTGQPTGGHVVEGVVESDPIGVNSGSGRTMAHNTRAGGNPPGPYDSSSVDNSYMTPNATTTTGTTTYSTIEEHDLSTGGHQMSAMPGHRAGRPTGGHVVEGVVESHPMGMNIGTGRTMAHNIRVDGNPPGSYDGSGVDNSYMTPDATTTTGTATYSTVGEHSLSTGGHQMSAMPGHGTGQPTGGHVVEGVVESHPFRVNSGTGRTMAHNTRADGNPPSPYDGTGGSYS